MLVLLPPVPGPIVKPFAYAGSPFRAGLHRGLDLRAAAGQGVRAPCSGAVVYAGRFGLTLRCARYRVTLLPVVPLARGHVTAGERVGRAQGNLHLGVRRAGDAFGYVDPAPLLRRARLAPPVVPGPRSARPLRFEPRLARIPVERAPPLAPWPAWLGLALLLVATTRVVASSRPWPSTSRRRSSTSTRRRTWAMRTR
jgi:hypothetical protein